MASIASPGASPGASPVLRYVSQPQVAAALVLGLAALTGGCIELLKRFLIRWVERQPWRCRMISLQGDMMRNFGYTKSATADEAVVIDGYCFVLAICSHHLLMSLALAPVVFLGWDEVGSTGQFLFYAGAVGDVAFSVYDGTQITLRTFFPQRFTCLGVPMPVKFFFVMVCLHHALSILLTVPMLLCYPSMRALHLVMASLLFAGGTSFLLGCYKFTLDTQHSRRDFFQFKAIVLMQFVIILITRAYVWVSQSYVAMVTFYTQGNVPFLCIGLVGGVLMTLFNLLTIADAAKAALKWLPRQMARQAHGLKQGCQESPEPLKPACADVLRRVQGARVALATQ